MIMEQNRRFADMLETLKKKGVVRNQQQFVEMVGVDKSLVSNVKNEKVPLSDDLLQKVEKAFPMVSIDWIKSGEGANDPS